MITENTHAENNDWQEPGGEQSSASEMSAQLLTTDAPAASQEQATPTDSSEASATTQAEEAATFAQPGKQEAHPSTRFAPVSNDEQASAENAAPVTESEAIRPFTDFIEEFRQTEERLSTLLADARPASSVFTDGSELLHEPVVLAETAAEDLTHVIDTMQSTEEQAPANSLEAVASTLAQETSPAERPVSPLLRPASRLRLPRHGRHRVEEPEKPIEQPQPQAQLESEQPAAEVAAPVEPPVEEPPARPARRYRFDRPAATASASPASAKAATPAAPTSEPETKGKRGTNFAAKKEQPVHAEPAPAHTTAETSAPKTPVQETPATSVEATPPAAAPTTERRRRGSHDRQREKEKEKEKEQAAAAPVVAPAPEPVVASVESISVEETEIAIEDLPPLEYADLQAASSRRRRRRRIGGVSATASTGANSATPKAIQPELPVNLPHPPAFASPKNVNASAPLSYNIVSGYTVSQMNQGNDVGGPFMGPEPSPARGSTFGTPTPLRHAHSEALRGTPSHPVKHSEGGALMSSAAVNHLANAVAQAIQTQTDRMVAEMRRANQVPTNVSVSLPPFPSTERVGVFVDVANLLYSARTLRMTIDFGKLLDFLRGNRRLVRAQAYCPTSPQPSDDQMFLQAVKGLGYRITTKNYKTFSSGAKKADLDLDLCMDVVRLVDGKAVDCVVLVSGDSDFMPMLDYCSDHGVRVEIAAFDESMSATLRQACDLFVNLSMLEEIRA